MTSLRNLQETFQAYLLGDSSDLEQAVISHNKTFAKTRLAIYSEAYVQVLLEILETCFPTVLKLLGNKVFEELGIAYIQQYPSRHFSVAAFGVHYAEFLRTTMGFPHQSCASELARFEWSLSTVIDDTPDGVLLTLDDMRQIPQEKRPTMSFTTHPCLRLLTNEWNVTDLFHAAETKPTGLSKRVEKKPNTCVIWRKDFEPQYHVLSEQDAWCMNTLYAGQSFDVLCEGLSQWYPEEAVVQHAVNLLMRCLNDKMLSAVTY